MKRNLFNTVFQRENLLQTAIFDFFFALASYPRLALEVFLRRKMGRRYFTAASALTVAVLLLVLPLGFYGGQRAARTFFGHPHSVSFMGQYATWYIFTLLFLWFSHKRNRETFPHINILDYNHFSLSSGIPHRALYKLPIYQTPATNYTVEVFVEPLLFFLPGLILVLLSQPLGFLLVVCSICYGFSYAASYKRADNYFQDLIDKIILAQEIDRAFIQGLNPDSTRGVYFKSRPADEDLRRVMAGLFFSRTDAENAEEADLTVD